MTFSKLNKHARGFTLIEVSVASLLIMLGVTGYVTLQSEYVIADAKLNLRNLALDLAQQKLSDLAFFQQLSPKEGLQSYQGITDNSGGNITAGERDVLLSSDSVTHTFDTQWQVEDWYFVDTTFDSEADKWVKPGDPFFPSILPRKSDLKRVSITVSWRDTHNDPKQLTIYGAVTPIGQSQSFQAKYRSPSALAKP